jgi:hypothetical protein
MYLVFSSLILSLIFLPSISNADNNSYNVGVFLVAETMSSA